MIYDLSSFDSKCPYKIVALEGALAYELLYEYLTMNHRGFWCTYFSSNFGAKISAPPGKASTPALIKDSNQEHFCEIWKTNLFQRQ